MKKIILFCFAGLFLVNSSADCTENIICKSDSSKRCNFTLSVYGNANGDDSIDKNDIEYIQGVISGKYKANQFADANVDGKIDDKDVQRIRDIVNNQPTVITLVDNTGVTVTVNAPVKRVAVLFYGPLRPVLHLQGMEGIVGIGSRMLMKQYNWPTFYAYPQLRKLPELGSTSDPSPESILLTKPDLILGTMHTNLDLSKTLSQSTGVPFIYANPVGGMFTGENGAYETWRLLSVILGKKEKERAEELIQYCEAQINEIQKTVKQIPAEKRIKVLLLAHNSSKELFSVATSYEPIILAGGNNPAAKLNKDSTWWGAIEVSAEQILLWNPDIILFHSYSKTVNFITRQDILANPVLRNVKAIKNKNVYGTKAWSAGWDPATALAEVVYMAKIFYPEQFNSLNMEEKGNEILNEFYKTPDLYTWILENCGEYKTWSK